MGTIIKTAALCGLLLAPGLASAADSWGTSSAS
jgi:hypothetical protein